MIRPIIFHPDPRLKRACCDVADITGAVHVLAEDMLETMYDAPGIGLAAPQIGVMERILVLDCVKEDGAAPDPKVMINPRILAQSDRTNIREEGCLSIPEHFAEVTRPSEIEVLWFDQNGAEHKAGFDGLWATCIQHEIDHLDGKLFIDYLGAIKRQMITRKMQKFKREIARSKAE